MGLGWRSSSQRPPVIAGADTNNFDPGKRRAHRRAEAEAGFPLLRGCPNTAAIALVNYLDTLSPADQVAYGEQLSSLEEAQAANPPKTNNEFLDLVRARPLLARHMGPSLNLVPPEAKAIDIRVVPVKLLSAVLKDNGGLEGWAKRTTQGHLGSKIAPKV